MPAPEFSSYRSLSFCTPWYERGQPLVAPSCFLPSLIIPIRGRLRRPRQLGAAVSIHSFQSEAISRGARMLRTAFGPAIARFLEDPAIIEVMLNPDGRLWIDRLSGGLAETTERLSAPDGERHPSARNDGCQPIVYGNAFG